ncbi:MAG: ABC transporter ATP-binding protein [Muribaculaceae bacterium]|nr:ABC transporter ATP-binding protein [Muribaculaceae bacterium]
MILLENLSLGFNQKILLKDVYNEYFSGKLTALIGRNGSGKSTLLKAICGLNNNYQGAIKIDGKNIKDFSATELAHTVAYVNTSRPRLSNLRAEDIVKLGRSPHTGWHGKLSRNDYIIIEEALNMVGMTDFSIRYFSELSDGEAQKIMIARAIAQDTPVIILDEPTSFLDLPSRFDLVSLLKNLSLNKGKTIIFSTHELDIATRLCDYISLLDSPNLTTLPTLEMIEHLKTDNHPFSQFL